MNKKMFHQSSSKVFQLIRHSRSNKLSMDDLTPLMSRAPSDLKKRCSNDHFEQSKIQRSTYKKTKMNSTVSVTNSILVSKNTSPIKFSLRNSQMLPEQRGTDKCKMTRGWDKKKANCEDRAAEGIRLKEFKFFYQIGFGGFGRVWKVSERIGMRQLAMKQISKRKVIQKNNIESVLNQRKILSRLTHPFLINMQCAFQDQQNLYLVMDYLRGGDLRYHICYKQGFNQRQIKFVISCILVGLEYIHNMNIIHKDLKPQNIVFEQNGYARITDFGIARNQLSNGAHNKNQSSGTPVYMAPEILFKKEYSYQSDFYALGVIAYELVMGKRPYQGKNRSEIREQLLKKQVRLSSNDLPEKWSPHLADLINRLLEKDPVQRLGYGGAKQIKQHKYFSETKWKRLQRKQVKPPFIPGVISEMKEYLDEIALFNQLNEQNSNQQNLTVIDQITNDKFKEYDWQKDRKTGKVKPGLKKGKRLSQKKLVG